MTEHDDDWILPALLDSREAYQERLKKILPQATTGVTSTENLAAASIAFAAMYMGAIGDSPRFRPTMVTWMSDEIVARRSDEERRAYYRAARRGEKAVEALFAQAGVLRGTSWYVGNSREQVRDESIKKMAEHGAVLERTDLAKTSPTGRYSLEPGFAALLDPHLAGETFDAAVIAWQDTHLSPTGKRRAARQRDPNRSTKSVTVSLPEGGQRILHPGESSAILKGVLEFFAPKLQDPSVLFISQPGEKVNPLDAKALKEMGLAVDQAALLPDCLIADLAPERDEFWFIEVVATDGPITDARKSDLLEWATSQNLKAEQCRFLTAFASRTSSEAKKCLPQLAPGSYAWFDDEPENLLTWDVISFE
ncbi:BsuBI/PstI family type II restriction endonuclease [Streptomyces cylindrosporus]|uniref:Restriction endonuclease n=1 Tax=Streptomyces cylindrosporus TaxID=2927583 RepID=A0ABS9XYQ2_9ACTN|nr:BsuBI/PstI family type II restriction endonuclease [Streptomyces cylindrosporus]MCI3270113.1 hypothetical protein [Streptomyces cylindrosporus]